MYRLCALQDLEKNLKILKPKKSSGKGYGLYNLGNQYCDFWLKKFHNYLHQDQGEST